MASQSAQNRANALNQKIESQAGTVLEDIERNWLRKVARESFACAVKCYDKAGSTGPQNALEQCARSCQIPYQQSTQMVQNVRTFLDRCNFIRLLVVSILKKPFIFSTHTHSLDTRKEFRVARHPAEVEIDYVQAHLASEFHVLLKEVCVRRPRHPA